MAADKIEKDEFGKMLIDVRRSYRFLYLFQQRILDLVKFIGNYYQFPYYGGWSHFSNTIRKGKGKLENWAWDWLPMYDYDFVFSTPIKLKEEDSDTLIFSVLLQCDTGYFDLNKPSSEQRTQIQTFIPPAQSNTFLHIVLRENKRSIQDYKNTQVKSNSREKFYDDSTGLIIGYKFPLVNFLDESSTRTQLKIFADYVAEKTKIDLKNLSTDINKSAL